MVVQTVAAESVWIEVVVRTTVTSVFKAVRAPISIVIEVVIVANVIIRTAAVAGVLTVVQRRRRCRGRSR